MAGKNPQPPISSTKLPPHPDPKDPKHAEWVVDEGEDESFPASDAPTATQPKPKPTDPLPEKD